MAEAVLFPIVYILYIATVLLISFLRVSGLLSTSKIHASIMQKWWKRRKLRKELPPEEVSFNKTQDAVTVKVSQKFAPEEENRPKTPSPMEYDNHPGHAGPMLRDGRLKGGREGRRANDEARLSRRRDPAYVQNDISLVESIKTINNISHDVYTAVVCAKMWV